MKIFDDIPRDGQEPASHLIGPFNYLNESGRAEAAKVRALLEAWIDRYPAAHQAGMIGRLRSRDETLHRSAFFELFLHELLLVRGFIVVEIEPTLPNGKAPDFQVQAPDGSQFYLEATLATGMDKDEVGASKRMREALQAIDDVKSPDFFLHLQSGGKPSQPISTKRLRNAVQKFVDGLDYDGAVRAAEENRLVTPLWRHEEHGAQFAIRPVPKNVRGLTGRAIGGRMLPGGMIQPHLAIKSAVEGKAGRYGALDLPLVIAVNALGDFTRTKDAIDALFGSRAIAMSDIGETREYRNTDGVWQGPRGPVYTRASAVFCVDGLSPWSIAQRSPLLILNPWASNPLPPIPLGIETRHVVDNRLMTEPGQTLREIFDLPEDWPE